MSDKICGNCWWFHEETGHCVHHVTDKRDGSMLCCSGFVSKKVKTTVFRKITASPEVLAARSVYAHENCRIPDGATSPFIDNIFWFDDEKGDTWDERFDSAWKKAIAATVARLKEVEK